MQEEQDCFELVIKEELLDEFCKKNNFIIITNDMLMENHIYIDFVYATNHNFIGKNVYPKNMPVMINKEIWEKILKINNDLKEYELCLKIYDAYRPIEIQKIFWKYFYDRYGFYDESFVANPDKYGTHNITLNAIDISVVDLNGNDVELPCSFDDFSEKAGIHYNNCSEQAKYNRDLLISTANKYGLIVNEDEWWHFYDDRLKKYGMKYDYINTEFVPKNESQVFILKKC